MSPEEPTTAHTRGSSEGDGGREGPVETDGGEVGAHVRADARATSDPANTDTSTGHPLPNKLGAWARRWLAPRADGSPSEPNGPAMRQGPVAPRWPGASQPDPDGSSETGEQTPHEAVDDAAVDAAAAVDTSAVDKETETLGFEPDTRVGDATSPVSMPASPATAGKAVPLPEPPPEPTDELPTPAHLPVSPAPAPATSPRKRRPRPRRAKGRVVTERLRHVGPWSVLKVAGLFYICLVLTVLAASVVLWQLGRSTGTVDQMESFVSRLFSYGECIPRDEVEPGTSFQLDDDCPQGSVLVGGFEVDDPTLLRSALIGGGIFVGAATFGTVLLAVLFNLLSDVTGGVRYTIVRGTVGTTAGSTRRRSRH